MAQRINPPNCYRLGNETMGNRPVVGKPRIKDYWWADLRGHDFGRMNLDGAIFVGCLLDGVDFSNCMMYGATIAFCTVVHANNPVRINTYSIAHSKLEHNNFHWVPGDGIVVDLDLANTATYLLEVLPRDGKYPGYPDLLRPYLGKVPHPSMLAPLAQLCFTDQWLLYLNAFAWSKDLLLQMVKRADDCSIPAAVLMIRLYMHLDLYWEVHDVLKDPEYEEVQYDDGFGEGAKQQRSGFEEDKAQWLAGFRFACRFPWEQGSNETSWLFRFIERTSGLFRDVFAAYPSPLLDWLSYPDQLSVKNWKDLHHLYINSSVWALSDDEDAALSGAFEEALSYLIRSKNEELLLVGLQMLDRATFFHHEGNGLLPEIGENASTQEARDLAYWIMFQQEYPNEKRLAWLRAGKLSEAYLAELAAYDYFWEDENRNPLMPMEEILRLLQSKDPEQLKEGLWWASIFPYPALRAQLEELTEQPDHAPAVMVSKAIARVEAFLASNG